MIMRELKILLCIPLEIVMLVINILHSIVALMSTLLVTINMAVSSLYRQILEENENNKTINQDNEPSN